MSQYYPTGPAQPKAPRGGFGSSFIYGLTGYKPDGHSDDLRTDTFMGMMTGEIAGYVGTSMAMGAVGGPVGMGVGAAVGLLRGVKAFRTAHRAARVANVFQKKAGRQVLQQVGFSPKTARRLSKEIGRDLRVEMLFQTGKMGVGYGSGTEDLPIGHKMLEAGLIAGTVPVGNVAVRGVWNMVKGLKPREMLKLNQEGVKVPAKETDLGLEPEVKSSANEAVRQMRKDVFERTQMDNMTEDASDILEKAEMEAPDWADDTAELIQEPYAPTDVPKDPFNDWGDYTKSLADEQPEVPGSAVRWVRGADGGWTKEYVKVGEREAASASGDDIGKAREAIATDGEERKAAKATKDGALRWFRDNFVGETSNLRHDLSKAVKKGTITPEVEKRILSKVNANLDPRNKATARMNPFLEFTNQMSRRQYEHFSRHYRFDANLHHKKRYKEFTGEELADKYTEGQLEASVKLMGDAANGNKAAMEALDITQEEASEVLQQTEWLKDFMQKGILDRLNAEGMINDHVYNTLSDQTYLPRIFRLDEVEANNLTVADVLSDDISVNPLGSLKGGIDAPMETDLKALVTRAFGRVEFEISQNNISRRLAEVADAGHNDFAKMANDSIDEVTGETIRDVVPEGFVRMDTYYAGKNEDAAFWKGRKRGVFVPKEIAEDMKKHDPIMNERSAGILSNLLLVSPLKKAAVYFDPYFGLIRNSMLEIQSQIGGDYAGVRSGFIPKAVYQAVSSARSIMPEVRAGKGKFYDAYIENGGVLRTWSAEADSAAGRRGKDFNPEGFIDTSKWPKGLKKAENIASYATKKSETMWRLSMFRDTLEHMATKNGLTMDEALTNKQIVEEAVEYADSYFPLHEQARSVRFFDTFVPFLHAHHAVARGQIRSMTKNPRLYAWRVSQAMALGQSLYLYNRQTNAGDYDKVSAKTKAQNFIMMTPFTKTFPNGQKQGRYMALPKDDFMAPFISAGELVMKRIVEGEAPVQEFLDSLERTTSMVPFTKAGLKRYAGNPAISAIAAGWWNYDIYSGDQVWNQNQQNLDAELKYTPRTSQLAKDIGGATGKSPAHMEAAFGKIFTQSNPFLRVGGFAYKTMSDAVSDNIVEEEFTTNEIIDLLPTADFFKTVPKYPAEAFEVVDEIKTREKSWRKERDHVLTEMLKDQELGHRNQRDINKFLNQQPEEEKKRLMKQVEFFKKTKNLMNLSLLRALSSVPPQARPEALLRVYANLPTEEGRAKLLAEAKLFPGLVTRDDFWTKFNEYESRLSGRKLVPLPESEAAQGIR